MLLFIIGKRSLLCLSPHYHDYETVHKYFKEFSVNSVLVLNVFFIDDMFCTKQQKVQDGKGKRLNCLKTFVTMTSLFLVWYRYVPR